MNNNLTAAVVITTLIGAGLVYSHYVRAEWGGFPVVGFQYELPSDANGQFFCKEGGSQVVAMPYLRQPIYRYKGFSWVASINHKSCAFGSDTPSYDAIGTGIELDTCWIFDKCR